MSTNKSTVISHLKEWISPFLISAIGMLIWRDLTELRHDVKNLLYQQSANEVKIENLQKEVDMLRAEYFNSRKYKQSTITIPKQSSDDTPPQKPTTGELVALRGEPPSIEKNKIKRK